MVVVLQNLVEAPNKGVQPGVTMALRGVGVAMFHFQAFPQRQQRGQIKKKPAVLQH